MTTGGARSRALYLDALEVEIDLWSAEPPAWSAEPPAAGDRSADAAREPVGFDTVYLGGGTPSALAAGDLDRVLAAIRSRLPLTAGVRLLAEANPEDVTAAALAAWRRLGVGFLSLGVQSFDDRALSSLGRRHDSAGARRAVAESLAAGIDTVSIDLIYGFPGQSVEDLRHDLAAAVELAPQHVSCYQLEVHPGTPFGRRREKGELTEAPEARQAELFALTHELLADAGYAAYEVSNFAAAPEHRSPHNRKYWSGAPYLGIGPSAHSFDGAGERWWNERRLGPWRGRLGRGEKPIAGRERLSAAERTLERLMLGLRTAEGVDLAALSAELGDDLAAVNRDLLDRLAAEELLRTEGDRLVPTRAGLAVADGVAAAFEIPAAP